MGGITSTSHQHYCSNYQVLYEHILTRFRCPLTIVTNQGTHFINDVIKYLADHFILRHTNFTIYYQKRNGQVVSTNKVFGILLTKLVNENKNDWDEHLSIVFFSCQIWKLRVMVTKGYFQTCSKILKTMVWAIQIPILFAQ
jgi:hypothetical protein